MTRQPHTPRARRPLLWAAVLLAALALCDGIAPRPARRGTQAPPHAVGVTVASARGAQGQETFEELQTYLDGLEQAEDVPRVIAYRILLQFLPAGTRMTSGFRDKGKQLSLIRDFARRAGINPPDRMVLDERGTWEPTWLALRGRGYIIADPFHTPHGDPDRIVFDLGGPDLQAIKQGCLVAQSKGMVTFLRDPLVENVNRCVHLEVKGFPDARVFGGLATRPPSYTRPYRATGDSAGGSSGSSANGSAATPAASPDEQTKARLDERQRLVREHDTTTDLKKKIDYDLLIVQTLDMSNPEDLALRSTLINEMRQHEQDAKDAEIKAQQDAAEREKQELKAQVAAAQREGRDDVAERLARTLSDKYDDQKDLYNQLVLKRMIGEAKGAFIQGDCNKCSNVEGRSCEPVDKLVGAVLEKRGDDPEAKELKEELETLRNNCRWERRARGVLLVLLAAGLLVGLYFWLRPGKYVLEGTFGPCKGEVFALDRPRVRIGAMPRAEEEEEENVDIFVSDRDHKISRIHCLLTQSGRHWYLRDESSNGTKVNDLAVQKGVHQKLEGGDEISLADEAVLLFRRR